MVSRCCKNSCLPAGRNETGEFRPAVCATSELNFIVPHLEQCPNHALGFSVRLRSFHASESLRDFVFRASSDEVVTRFSAVLRAVVGVNCLDRIRTFRENLSEKFRRAELCFVWCDCGKKFAGIVVDRDKKILAR